MAQINLLENEEVSWASPPKRNCHPRLRKYILYIFDNFITKLYNFFKDFDDRLIEKKNVIKRIDIDEYKLTELIFNEYERVYCNTNYKPKYCFIGRDEWLKFHYDLDDELKLSYNIFSFNINPKINRNGYMEYNGLKCIHVPWMDGIVCLPDIDKI